ncbi:MAG TPA: thiol:disulfide interchange protein DsbA/DsbL [Gammaproteobacteria bacterium]|nr:thiol:disulfide interchange protein DsbA/DsbL [Gammaproteobacteria bacterium]
MYSRLLKALLPFALLFAWPGHAAETFQAGKHYNVIAETPTPTASVMEFFSYGCGACFNFDPYMKHLKTALGDQAEVEYIPVDFGGGFWTPTQQLFLVLETQRREAELHDAVFQFIHGERKGRVGPAAVREFAARHGIDEAEFDKSLKGFYATSRKNRYDQLTRRYGISATPTIIVNGKYQIENRALTTPDAFVELVKFLLKNP